MMTCGSFFQNISENKLGSQGFDALCKMLYINTTLKDLNVSGTCTTMVINTNWMLQNLLYEVL